MSASNLSTRPPPAKPRRPKFLVVALLMALVFGAGCWTEGCGRLAFYRDPDALAEHADVIKDEQDKQRIDGLYQRYLDAADAQRGRSIPFSAAIFVLGAALLALTARGLAGKSNTRSALMQVVAAQAIVVGAAYFATKDMRNAELDWKFEETLAVKREDMPPDKYAALVPQWRALRVSMPPAWLGFRSVASVLIIIALSRQKAREFFEAAAAEAASDNTA
jgi:hypothetical protein